MKKMTLMVVCLLLSALSYSQDYYRVVRATQLEYRDTGWAEVQTQYPKDLFLIINGYEIRIGQIKYMTYDAPEKSTYSDHIVYSWKCVDPQGNNCFYMMKQFDKNLTTHVYHNIMYANGTSWEYETE